MRTRGEDRDPSLPPKLVGETVVLGQMEVGNAVTSDVRRVSPHPYRVNGKTVSGNANGS